MPVVILLFFLVAFAAASAVSSNYRIGNLRRSAANPMLLLMAYIVLVGGDYLSMAISGHGYLAQRDVSTHSGTLTWLAFQHALSFCMLCLGIYAGLVFESRRKIEAVPTGKPQRTATGQRRHTSAMWTFLILLLVWAFLLRQSGGEDVSLTNIAYVKQSTTGDVTLFVASLLLLPAFTYALPNVTWRTGFALAGIAIVVLFFSGSRTRLLYVAIPLLLAMTQIYRFRLPRYYFLAALVGAGILSIAVLNLRFASVYGEGADYASVSGANVFDINDISFAEASVELNKLPTDRIEGYVGEDLVGGVLAGFPRSVAPIKPLAGSNQFTSVYDPIGWKLYGRGLTIGGINEVNFDYGYPGALIVLNLLGGLLGYALGRFGKARTVHGFAGLVAMYAMLYQLLKADLQSAGQVAFSFVIYYLVVLAASAIGRVINRKPSPRIRLRPAGSAGPHPRVRPNRPGIARR